jgi:hypothetical protein
MSNNQPTKSSQDSAKRFIDEFGLKSKLIETFNEKSDESLILVFTANLTIFSVAATILFTADKSKSLTAPLLVLFLSAVISLIGALLNLWYLVRLKKRMEILRNEQEKVLSKTEANLVKTFGLFEKIVNFGLKKSVEHITENNKKIEILEKQNNIDFDFLVEGGAFIPFMIMELALNETKINIRRSLNTPLNEKYAGLKLFVDRFSDKFRNWCLILSSAFVLCALLIKFLIG